MGDRGGGVSGRGVIRLLVMNDYDFMINMPVFLYGVLLFV